MDWVLGFGIEIWGLGVELGIGIERWDYRWGLGIKMTIEYWIDIESRGVAGSMKN